MSGETRVVERVPVSLSGAVPRERRRRVLVVHSDPARAAALASQLGRNNWDAQTLAAGSGLDTTDVIVADYPGPGLLEPVRRAMPHVPVLFLTTRHGVEALAGGAAGPGDDYLLEPFTAEDLALRLLWCTRSGTAVTTPNPGGGASDRAELAVGDLSLRSESLLARRAGANIALSKTQTSLLHLLMTRAGTVVSKDEILNHVWGEAFTGSNDNKVELFVSYLRRKINAHGPAMIRTIRNGGYMIENPDNPAAT